MTVTVFDIEGAHNRPLAQTRTCRRRSASKPTWKNPCALARRAADASTVARLPSRCPLPPPPSAGLTCLFCVCWGPKLRMSRPTRPRAAVDGRWHRRVRRRRDRSRVSCRVVQCFSGTQAWLAFHPTFGHAPRTQPLDRWRPPAATRSPQPPWNRRSLASARGGLTLLGIVSKCVPGAPRVARTSVRKISRRTGRPT